MRLVCLLEHMKNQSVSVNGSEYVIDAAGEAYVGVQADAKALLANASGWMVKPDPLMPLGDDGNPEHLYVPPQYKTAPPSKQDPIAQARLAQENPTLVPATPFGAAVASPLGPNLPGPMGGAGAPVAAAAEPGPSAGLAGFDGAPVRPDDIIAAAEPIKNIAVSSPEAPPDARLGKTTHSKKGNRK